MKRRRLRKPFQIMTELIMTTDVVVLVSLDNFQLSLKNLGIISILLSTMIASAMLLIAYGKEGMYGRQR